MTIPSWRDPRWSILAYLALFDVYALTAPFFNRTVSQYAASISTCLACDLLFSRLRTGKWNFPLSALITSFGILLLCDSPYVWPYTVIALVSILSKHALRVDGRHIFNPNNFGIVFGLMYMSGKMVVDGGRWGNTFAGMGVIAVLGMTLVWRANRWAVSAGYLGGFLGGAVVRSLLTGIPFATLCFPLSGAAFNLFTYYMITDPATSPGPRRQQAAFGLAVGLVDAVFRYGENRYAPFFALFAVCAAAPLLRGSTRVAAERTPAGA